MALLKRLFSREQPWPAHLQVWKAVDSLPEDAFRCALKHMSDDAMFPGLDCALAAAPPQWHPLIASAMAALGRPLRLDRHVAAECWPTTWHMADVHDLALELDEGVDDDGDCTHSRLLQAFSGFPALRSLSVEIDEDMNASGKECGYFYSALALHTGLTHLAVLLQSDFRTHRGCLAAAASNFVPLRQLARLHLEGMAIDESDADALAEAAPQLTALTALVLKNMGVSSGGDRLTSAIASFPSLLDLQLTYGHLEHMLPAVWALTALTHLSVDFDMISGHSEAQMQLDGKDVLPLPSLENLRISAAGADVCMNADGFAVALRGMPQLTALCLVYLDVEGSFQNLVNAIADLPKLVSLNMWGCDNRTQSWAEAAPALERMQHVKHLDVADLTAPRTLRALPALTALTALTLKGRTDDDEPCFERLAAALTSLSSLRHLHLDRIDLSDGSTTAMSELAALSQLTKLRLGFTHLPSEAVTALASVLPRWPLLRHVDISGNAIDGSAASAIARALPHLTALQELSLRRCFGEGTGAGVVALVAAANQLSSLTTLDLQHPRQPMSAACRTALQPHLRGKQPHLSVLL